MSDYYDLGPYSRKITTVSDKAQLWFDRGLNWCYGYRHEEAIACFQQALKHDPDCAMAWWGVAYATGPNYNMPWHLYDPKGRARTLAAAFDATEAALARIGGTTHGERALIEALKARYPQRDPIDEMWPWNDAFADAMRGVHQAAPDDLDLRCVFVEAIMNRTPWQMWDLQSGKPAERAGTEEAMAVLDEAFSGQPASWDHPGLLHLHVHLMEMSPFPQRALRTGDRLRELVPDAGHLIHMPTHIDVLCGNYRDVLAWNLKAIEADDKAVARDGAMNFYTLYRVHNFHFAIYGAMFLGQYEPALAAAEGLIATIPEELLRQESPPMADFVEAYLAMKQHVLVRFGKWQEITDQDLPADPALYCATTTMMHYAKAVAYAALGDVAAAEEERERFREARQTVPESRRVHNNICWDLFNIAEEMASGEIEYRRGNFDAAFAHLRRSVALDDALPYDEPWGWMQPTRHALGALLLEQGEVDEAEAVYRADLGLDSQLSRACQHPDNPWALHGLLECLKHRGDTAEAVLIKQRLDLAGARSDVPITASCFCRLERAA
jgi:tetratricopeptide (TPR) repeat protein